jgi:hypothetical protein
MPGLLLILAAESSYDFAKRLLFTHIPKNAGTSIQQGIDEWNARHSQPRACSGFNYLAEPAGDPERLRGFWLDIGGWLDHVGARLGLHPGGECQAKVYPQCDLTQHGMGCIGGMPSGVYHQSEECVRAEMRLCSHDGLPPILAPDSDGVVQPVVSFAVIRSPLVLAASFAPAPIHAFIMIRCGVSLRRSNLASTGSRIGPSHFGVVAPIQ